MNRIALFKKDGQPSTNIKSAGYDKEGTNLEVEFWSGDVYTYHHIPERIWRGLLEADSPGAYFNTNVKAYSERYPYTKTFDGKTLQAQVEENQEGNPKPNNRQKYLFSLLVEAAEDENLGLTMTKRKSDGVWVPIVSRVFEDDESYMIHPMAILLDTGDAMSFFNPGEEGNDAVWTTEEELRSTAQPMGGSGDVNLMDKNRLN